jgi:hypothetical protein
MVRSAFSNGRLLDGTLAFLLLCLTGLALTRLLYEAAFPSLLWLVKFAPVLLLALLFAISGLMLWRIGNRHLAGQIGRPTRSPLSVWTLAPLLLNLVWILNPTVDLVYSRFTFAVSVWLTAVLIAHSLVPARSWPWLGLLFYCCGPAAHLLINNPSSCGQR